MIRVAYTSFGILCALMLLVAGPAAQRTDSAQARLRAAADAATVEGDLRKAIAQYQSIVDAYPADRPVVAMALVGMAEAYQKLGNAEAEKLYERLVRDYADQAEAVAIARTRLGDRTAARPVAGDRAVLTGPNVNGFGTVTADGRFMTYVDGETQQVTLRDLRNGTDRPLTSGTRAYIARDARPLTAISRDGRQVAFEWATPNSGEIELRLANLEGTGVPESRRLLAFKLDDALAISVFDWSPDGKWLVVSIQRPDLVGQLSLVSVQDGSYRVLKSIGWTGPHRAFFSPDGRSLAYSVPADDTLDESRVFVMAVDGSRERVVVDHPSRNIIMGWSPDGGSVLFSSNRGGSAGLWMVPVTDGQSVRAATLLKSSIGSSWSLGVTSSGALFTWKSTTARYLAGRPGRRGSRDGFNGSSERLPDRPRTRRQSSVVTGRKVSGVHARRPSTRTSAAAAPSRFARRRTRCQTIAAAAVVPAALRLVARRTRADRTRPGRERSLGDLSRGCGDW
jgi:hypothetical protein